MDKITPAARREFSFPVPVDVQGQRVNEQNKKENDERQPPLQSTKPKRTPGAVSTRCQRVPLLVRPDCSLPARSYWNPGSWSVFTIDLAVELGVFAIPRKLPTRQPLSV